MTTFQILAILFSVAILLVLAFLRGSPTPVNVLGTIEFDPRCACGSETWASCVLSDDRNRVLACNGCRTFVTLAQS